MNTSVVVRGDAAQDLVRAALHLWSPANVLIAEVRPDTPLAGLGFTPRTWVSFALALRIASNEKVVITDSSVGALTTVGDLLAQVREQLNR